MQPPRCCTSQYRRFRVGVPRNSPLRVEEHQVELPSFPLTRVAEMRVLEVIRVLKAEGEQSVHSDMSEPD